MELLEELNEVIEKLDSIDDYCDSLIDQLSSEDKKTQDLLHYLENNKLGTFESWRLVKRLQKIRIDRRKIKNNIELASTFNTNKNKLSSKNTRQFLKNELYKREKQLQTKYKNRYYQDCEIENILKGK